MQAIKPDWSDSPKDRSEFTNKTGPLATIQIIDHLHREKQITVLPLQAVPACRKSEEGIISRIAPLRISVANQLEADLQHA
jgi:hypothetical protein